LRKEKASLEDFRIVDNFIDLLAPAYEGRNNPEIRKARKAWSKILLTFGSSGKGVNKK
jgi:hypothetical protein